MGKWFYGLLALVGCASITNPKETDFFGVVDRFHHDLRWKYGAQVLARIDPVRVDEVRDLLDELESNLSLTSWELRKVELAQDRSSAMIAVSITYYEENRPVVRTAKVIEHWLCVKDRWFLTSMEGGPFALSKKLSDE